MKRIIIILLLLANFNYSYGQSSAIINAIDTLRTFNYLYQTSPTCAGCVTHTNTGHIADSTLGLMLRMMSLISGSTNDLQSTLNAGYIATNGGGNTGIIQLQDLAGNTAYYQPSSASLVGVSTSTTMLRSGFQFRNPTLPYTTNVVYANPSANRTQTIPDEGTPGLPGTYVTHVTKDSVLVSNAGSSASLSYKDIYWKDGLGNSVVMGYDFVTNPSVTVADGVNSTVVNQEEIYNTNSVGRVAYVSGITNAIGLRTGAGKNIASLVDQVGTPGYDTLGELRLRNGYYYDSWIIPGSNDTDKFDTISESGKILTWSDTIGGAGHHAVIPTLYSMSTASVNIANTDLSQTADRHYRGNNHGLIMDSLSGINFQNIIGGGALFHMANIAGSHQAFSIINDFKSKSIFRTNSYAATGAGNPDSIVCYDAYALPPTAGAPGQAVVTNGSNAWTYANVATIVGTLRLTGQTGAVSLTPISVGSSDADFNIAANINITSSSSFSFGAAVAYTDENGIARTAALPVVNLAGNTSATITNTGGNVPYDGSPIMIHAQQGTTITIFTQGTFTGVTYNITGKVVKL